ncbi:hypothetical protein BFP77_03650 [Maribacter sp. 4U21]|uniref:DUF3332 domain-containing protein n=1 Tax=Maribacter sp. 4U21 TaxID=1889779 RepID=UPI000C148C96|nr:DUF3332 domain-containing protein [Maribacter sp. 4U21]PIB30881.1 hypothetical protein BFP77_03650 [Maribacter sp. 4U21]
MKKSIVCIAMASLTLFSSCLGSFSAFNNLKEWNQGVSDSKFVNNLVFWGLNIIPVYGLFFLGDTIIFNVIEFWDGTNPIAMEEGEEELQMVEKDGNTFEMVATKNRIQVTVVKGPKEGKKIDLVYKPDEKSWNAIRPNGEIIKLSSFEEGFYIVYMPNGKEVKINPLDSKEQGLALLSEHADCFYLEGMLAEN